VVLSRSDAAARPASTRPTALWVVPVSALAGVARHVLDVAGHGIPGWRHVVLCPPGPLADRLAATGAAVMVGPVGPQAGAARSVATVRHALRTLRPAVVHSHLAHADLVVAAAVPGTGAAHVSTEHGIAADDRVYHAGRGRSAAMAAVHAARLHRADAVLAVSEATAATVRDRWHPPRRLPVRVVRNGVDPVPLADRRTPGPSSGDGPHVLSLARLSPEKRPADLVEAFAVLHRRHPTARLTLAGDGPLAEPLRRLRHDLGLDLAVELPGHVDPGPLLDTADVLVQLSVWENASYALLDALAHGLGVVATPVGGNPELLPQRCLVEADDRDAVAAAIESQAEAAARPELPEGWPTVAEMCDALAEAYAEVAR